MRLRRPLTFCALSSLALWACSDPVSTEDDGLAGASATGGSAAGAIAGGTGGATAGASGSVSVAGAGAGAGAVGQGGAAGASGSGQGGAAPGAGAGGATSAGGDGGAGTPSAGNSGASGVAGAGLGGVGGSGAGGAGAGGKAGTGGKAGVGGAGGAGGAGGPGGKGGSGGAPPSGNITIWIAGDSTVATGGPCPIGWGGKFDALFNDQVAVTNSAVGGRSVRTWLYNVGTTMDSTGECVLARDGSGNPTIQSRWQAMLTGMKAGDYLFIQFGINDGSATCDRHVGLAAFKESYGMMAQAAKDRGAQPVFLTPVSAVACNGSTARATRGGYVTATQEAGTQYGVPVIDLHQLSINLYTASGFCPIPGGDVSASTTGPVGTFFCDDHTHFDTPGAVAIAGLVAQALRNQGIGLAAYLR